MKITLKKITLKNFKGVSKTFELSEEKNTFSGPNGSGKTTLFDAESWLRTGKDSLNRTDFEIKAIVGGKPIEQERHWVCAVYEIDGKQVELERVYFEKWSKKRGAVEETKSGNKTEYRIDGLEMSKRDYETGIVGLFGPNFSVVSDISAVPNMPWKKRREMLMELAPGIDQEKIIDSIPDFRGLLKDRPVETAKKSADQRLKKVIKSLGEIPAQISEHLKIVGAPGNLQESLENVKACEKAVADVQKKIVDAQSGDSAGAIEQLKKLNQSLIKHTQEHEQKKVDAETAITENRTAINKYLNEIKSLNADLDLKNGEIENLREMFAKIRKSTAENVGDTCEHCGQSLPDDQIKDREKNFMRDRSEDLEANAEQGKKLSGEIAKLTTGLNQAKSVLSVLKKFKSDHIQPTSPEIDSIKSAIEKLKSEQIETPSFTGELEEANKELQEAQEQRATIKATAGSAERIKELEAEKKELATENDKIQKFLSLYDEFNRAMAGAIEKPINDMFETVNFRLFDTLENGNVVDVCDITDKQNRPYLGALSNGEKIRAGLDIVRTLQKHFDISAPVWIDNAESVTGEIDLDCQSIELRADNNFETLTQG